jgi:hypothetical protein
VSISFKKINSMITNEVSLCDDLTEEQRRTLRDTCEKIYMLESSVESVSSQQLISDIRGEIILRADKFLGEDK